MIKKQPMKWLVASLLCCLLFAIGAVFAWQNTNQHKTFESETKNAQGAVTLRKYALDTAGQKTEQPLSGATFRLFKIDEDASKPASQIGVIYQTDQNGEIFRDNLSKGSYYFEEVTPPLGYDFLVDKDGKPITKTTFEIKGTANEHVYLDVYNAQLTGGLVIEKEVISPDTNGLTDADKAQTFSFTLTLTQNGKPVTDTFTYSIGNTEFKIKSGEKITLKHGQQAIFKDLPQGLHYQVTEDDVSGYVSHGSNATGDLSDVTQLVKFTNIKAIGGFELTKRVINAGSEQNDRDYEFTVIFSDGKLYQPYINGQRVQLTAGGKFTLKADETAYFADIPNGVNYQVTETSSADYRTDFATIVGTTIVNRVTSYVVTNDFEPIQPNLTGDLEIEKKVSGQGNLSDDFTFKLTLTTDATYTYVLAANGQTSEGQIKTGETFKMPAGAKFTIKGLPLGTDYQVEEIELGDYQATTLSLTGTISQATQALVATFENIAPPRLTIVKRLEGGSADPDKSFEFKLTIAGKSDQVFSLKANESKTVTLPYGASYSLTEKEYQSDGYRLTSFENASMSQVTGDVTATAINTYAREDIVITGEKTWVIPEGISLPDKITIQLLDAANSVVAEKQVQADEAGNWLYTFKVPKFDADGNEISYHIREVELPHFESQVTGNDIVNTYLAPVRFEPKVEKKIAGGQPSKAETFTFVLAAKDAQLAESQIVTISGAGSATFDALSFNKAGTYTYQIFEQTGQLSDYTYDRSNYTLTVTVEKSGQNLIISSVAYRRNDNSVTDWAIFTNHYDETPPSTSTPPSGSLPPANLPQTSGNQTPKTLPSTGDVVTIASVVLGLSLLALAYRKWLRMRRK